MRTRQESRRRAQERQRRNRLRNQGLLILGGLVVAAVIFWISYSAYQNQEDQQPLDGVQSFDLEAGHVQGSVEYEQVPPAGGPHHNVWQNCGPYSAPIMNETAVHSLEHGAVWITYQPELPADQVAIIRETAQNQTYVLTSPYPGLPAPVVASAWGKQLQLESATDDALDAFVRTYRQGPQTLEPGAPCTGGTSATQ